MRADTSDTTRQHGTPQGQCRGNVEPTQRQHGHHSATQGRDLRSDATQRRNAEAQRRDHARPTQRQRRAYAEATQRQRRPNAESQRREPTQRANADSQRVARGRAARGRATPSHAELCWAMPRLDEPGRAMRSICWRHMLRFTAPCGDIFLHDPSRSVGTSRQ